MRKILASIAILAALAGPAFADDSTVVKSVTLDDLKQILTEEGYTIKSTGDDGDVSIRAVDDDGLIFNVLGSACNVNGVDGCYGINMQVRYDADGDESLERINEANLKWAAATAWYFEQGYDGDGPIVGISRYVILDAGMTIGNIKVNLVNLLAIAPAAADYIWETGDWDPEDDY